MKHIFLITVLVFTKLSMAQSSDFLSFNFDAKYLPATVTFADGHTQDGFVYGFISEKFFTVNPEALLGFSTMETAVNLSDKKFDFKVSEDAKPQKVTSGEIVNVVLKEEDGSTTEYQYLGVKTVNGKGELIDFKQKVWLPVIRKDKINILGYEYYEQSGGRPADLMFIPVYLRNPKEDFAIVPIDFNRINLFNFGKLDDKFKVAIDAVFKDCPAFLEIFHASYDQKVSTFDMDKMKAEQKALKKAKGLSGAERRQKYNQTIIDFAINPYIRMVEEYKKACP